MRQRPRPSYVGRTTESNILRSILNRAGEDNDGAGNRLSNLIMNRPELLRLLRRYVLVDSDSESDYRMSAAE